MCTRVYELIKQERTGKEGLSAEAQSYRDRLAATEEALRRCEHDKDQLAKIMRS